MINKYAMIAVKAFGVSLVVGTITFILASVVTWNVTWWVTEYGFVGRFICVLSGVTGGFIYLASTDLPE